MTAEVLPFTGITSLDLDPARVLEAAMNARLTEVVIIGIDEDGVEYFDSSVSDGPVANWHLDRAKWKLMQISGSVVEGEQ
jgi:hypothetical protein